MSVYYNHYNNNMICYIYNVCTTQINGPKDVSVEEMMTSMMKMASMFIDNANVSYIFNYNYYNKLAIISY